MGKASTVTFISLVAAIIIFPMFISLFPDGIHISTPDDIFYDGDALQFYGACEGNGSAELRAYESNVTINNETRYMENLIISGDISFACQEAVLDSDRLFTSYVVIQGDDCQVTGNGINVTEIDGYISGNISIRFSGTVMLHESQVENRGIPFIADDFSRIFPARFDGIFFITNGSMKINGKNIDFSHHVFFRGEGLWRGGTRFEGTSHLTAVDGKFYDEEKKIFFIPVRVVILWVVAIALFIGSLYVKKNTFRERDEIFVGFSYVAAALSFAISFFLWHAELQRILGLNLFDMGNMSMGNVLFLSLAIVPYLVAIGIIGFPMSVAVSSLFSMVGLSNLGKGIGRSAGLLMTTFWGISLLSSILNVTFSPLLRLL